MEALNLLRSPELVADIQQRFGLYRNSNLTSSGLASTGLASAGLGSTGLASSGLKSTGLEVDNKSTGTELNSNFDCSIQTTFAEDIATAGTVKEAITAEAITTAASTSAASTSAATTSVAFTTSAASTLTTPEGTAIPKTHASSEEEQTSTLRLRNVSKEESLAKLSELNGVVANDVVLVNQSLATPLHPSPPPPPPLPPFFSAARTKEESISASLLNSGLEAHGIFSVRVKAQQRTAAADAAATASSPCSSGDEGEDEEER